MANFDYKKLKSGDVFYECSGGINIQAQAITSPVFNNDKWEWSAINMKTGEMISYMINVNYSHYGPKLYDSPQYVKIKDGEITVEYH